MIQTLSIKNVALISNLTIDFSNGFNVLLGETGAGKSIIFDALNFVLGGKADKTLIRYGEKEMRVDAIFAQLSEHCKEKLVELGYEDDEVCLSRTLSMEGKSSVRINGMIATATILKEVGKYLVDSYSQHESVELLKSKNHLAMLDKFAGENVSKQKEHVKEYVEKYHGILKQIESLGGDEFERERQRSLLQYQVDEIESANLQVGEDEEISESLKYLNSAEKIYQAVSECEELLSDGASSCVRSLIESAGVLSSLSSFEEIDKCRQRLESVRYEVEDIADTLVNIKSMSEFDEKEYDRLDRRNDLIKSLTKKYGGSVERVLNYLEEAKSKLNDLSDSEFLLGKLEQEKESVLVQLSLECDKLTKLRMNSAKEIEEKLLSELQQLGMKSSKFKVKFDKTKPSINGQDAVEFEFSANKGQEVKSLAKTASGGELSRFMLAVKNFFNEIGGPQTLVFDEIDSGISGETGNIVGQKIDKISKTAQILCITHLPQVAVYADHIYVVTKEENETTTQTKIQQIEDSKIVECLARMTVGDNLTDTSRKQALEMRIKAGKMA
ncbi:MAG: DNA repair protein RecN [Clostridia bacterium]|nr:DNA repair protein RecN [Clostridia bacterium]MBQ8792096.1 DNA repair protein RecN [Clostridia bacterium]